jgi:hypothetical protein
VQSVLEGAVAGMVYKNAIVSIPASLPFRAKFLDILRPYEFPGKAGLEVRARCACLPAVLRRLCCQS